MFASIRARYSRGVFVPLEPIALEEGQKVTLNIENAALQSTVSALDGGDSEQAYVRHETMSELFERLRNSVPEEVWQDVPRDWAMNKNHYLYGHAKVENSN